MTTSAAALPVLPPGADIRSITERLNALIRWFNRPDLLIPSYAADSGTGAAYVIAPSSDIKVYEVGQVYAFTAAHANTIGNPTLAVQGLPAGTIMRINGTVLSLGDIPAGPVAVICTSTTPTFALLTPYNNNVGAMTFLGSDIAIGSGTPTNAVNTGPIGAAGEVWLIEGCGCISDGGQATLGEAAIHDGTNYIASASEVGANASWPANPMPRAIVTLSGPTTFTLKVMGNSAGAGVRTTGLSFLKTNTATWISARRLA